MHIASTIKTCPMVIDGVFYKWYPDFSQADIGSNTANKFVDTLSMANPFCKLMGADYDGDQVTLKVAWTTDANEEIRKYANSKAQLITFDGTNGRPIEKEGVQALYNLTLVLPEDKKKMVNPVF